MTRECVTHHICDCQRARLNHAEANNGQLLAALKAHLEASDNADVAELDAVRMAEVYIEHHDAHATACQPNPDGCCPWRADAEAVIRRWRPEALL